MYIIRSPIIPDRPIVRAAACQEQANWEISFTLGSRPLLRMLPLGLRGPQNALVTECSSDWSEAMSRMLRISTFALLLCVLVHAGPLLQAQEPATIDSEPA